MWISFNARSLVADGERSLAVERGCSSVESIARRSRAEASGERSVIRTSVLLAERFARGDRDALAGELCGEGGAGQCRVADPEKVCLALLDFEAALRERRSEARSLFTDRADAGFDQRPAVADRLERSGLRKLGDAEIRVELGEQLLGARSTDRVADAGAGQPQAFEKLRKTSRRGNCSSSSMESSVGLRVGKVDERLVEQHRDTRRGPSRRARSSRAVVRVPVGSLGLAMTTTRVPGSCAASAAPRWSRRRARSALARRAISG